ncbi:MAG: ATP-binding cassette domain-containing protein [Natronospirillum sp.]
MDIKLNDVVKEYRTVRAVDGVSFSVMPGKITALLGPNGAGKSSLIRMLVGLTQPDRGNIEVTYQGKVSSRLPAGCFAYLPEDRGLYEERTVRQNLQYVARLRGVSTDMAMPRIEHWVARLGLAERIDEPMSRLSKGNQQKVQLISTLVGEPDLLILDEPFSGLDPLNQELVLDILREFRAAGKGVLLSAHQMSLVERVADELLLLNQGRAVAQGSLADVRHQMGGDVVYHVQFAAALSSAQNAQLSDICQVHSDRVADGCIAMTPLSQRSLHDTLQALLSIGEVVRLEQHTPSLHDLYLSALTKPQQEALA